MNNLDPDRMILIPWFCDGLVQGFVAFGAFVALTVAFDAVLVCVVSALAAVVGRPGRDDTSGGDNVRPLSHWAAQPAVRPLPHGASRRNPGLPTPPDSVNHSSPSPLRG
jgi:hypothetical protein